MSRGWSEEEDTLLRAMWADGLSAGQIRRQLPTDRSRSAVLGRVHRLGLEQRATSTKATRERVVARRDSLPAPRKAPVDNAKDPGPMDPPIDTMNLHDHHCKWPYDAPEGGYHYCGQPPLSGGPWCLFHKDKARQPSKNSAA